jgi:hypothetical protein
VRKVRGAIAILCLFAVAGMEARAVQTRVWVSSPDELERGETDGVAVSSKGRLFLAPRFSPLGPKTIEDPPAHVWAAIADRAGNLYLGTGPDGRILKVSPSGAERVLFSVEEPMVTALALTPEGDLLAGTAPEGRIYRIRPDGEGKLWCETGERYVWSLAVGPKGDVYAGTGERGILFRVDRTGRASPLFDSGEAHIMALVPLEDGTILAGGAGRGLLYRIEPGGTARVLHDDDLPEVRAIVREPDGAILAALVAPPEPEPRPPAVRIQLTGAEPGGEGAELPSEIEGRAGVPMQGVIEGLPSYREEGGRRLRGKILRIGSDGSITELWRSTTEAPFSLGLGRDGRPYFGTGEPARLYRVDPEGEIALLDTLREAQITGLATARGVLVAVTSNPGGAYRLEEDPPRAGTYASRPYDAGVVARWGVIRWRVEGKDGRVELQTRTGNSGDPDGSWSPWSDPVTDPDGSPISSPEGRFLQWRAKIVGSGSDLARIASVSLTFAPHNRAPAVRDLRIDGESSNVSGNVSFRWSAFDPDADPLLAEIQFRPVGSSEWVAAARLELPPKPSELASDGEPAWREGKASWNTKDVVDEGIYEIRLFLTDQPANPPGEGKEATAELSVPIVVDRSAPLIEARRVKGGAVEVTVTDALSPIARLEVVSEGRARFAARPLDGVCDGRREVFVLSSSDAGEPGSKTLRAVDAAGNAAELPLP